MTWLQTHTPDLLFLAGACAVTYGVSQFSAPVAWIVGGGFALAAAYLAARSEQ